MNDDDVGSGLAIEEVGKETRRSGSDPARALGNYLDGPTPERLEYLARAVLRARGEDTRAWEQSTAAVEHAARDPANHPLDCGCRECS